MEDFLVGGASAAAIIMILVQLAKSKGLSSDNAPILAIMLGIAFGILSELEQPEVGPPIARWTVAVIKGFMVGATSSGLYALIKSTQSTVDARKTEEAIERGEVIEAEVTSRPAQTSLIASTDTLGEGDTALRVSDHNTPTEPPTGAGGTPVHGKL